MRIRIIDETIKKNVDDEVNREMKRNKEDGIGINLQQKKKKHRGLSLTDKFFTLNMKSRYILENLTKITGQSRPVNNKTLQTEYNFSMTSRKYEDSVRSPNKFKFPSINKSKH